MSMDLKPRTSSRNIQLTESEFKERWNRLFYDPNFDPFRKNLEEISDVAFKNYLDGRKAPLTKPAGDNYKDPTYQLSEEWIDTKKNIDVAREEYQNQYSSTRVLLIMASDRNEATCPGEYSKTLRLAKIAQQTLLEQGLDVELLDLSLLTAEYGKTIHPCKGCVSTAMPLCHFPCSCYPNHSLGQSHDWMNEIYPKWIRAHGVMIISPVYWHQAPSCLKLMIDRLVCADGGNEDPTSTQGKNAELAKNMEMQGWDYPRHLKGRVFSVIVHGDAVGVDTLKNSLCSWMEEMELIAAPAVAQLARYIGYYEPYATSHNALDKDEKIQKEVQNAALSLALTTKASRSGELTSFSPDLDDPRPK